MNTTDTSVRPHCGRQLCSFCGAEIPSGAQYWYINGYLLCEDCLPEFARAEYHACRCVRGREDAGDAV